MSIARLPSGQWLAVGAFGRALRSADDGKTWGGSTSRGGGQAPQPHRERCRRQPLADPRRAWAGARFHRWRRQVGRRAAVLLARSTARRSSPTAAGWPTACAVTPSAPAPGAELDQGPVPAPISMFGHARSADDSLLVVGQGGIVLRSADAGASFKSFARATAPRSPTSACWPTAAGWWPATSACAASTRLRAQGRRHPPPPGAK